MGSSHPENPTLPLQPLFASRLGLTKNVAASSRNAVEPFPTSGRRNRVGNSRRSGRGVKNCGETRGFALFSPRFTEGKSSARLENPGPRALRNEDFTHVDPADGLGNTSLHGATARGNFDF